jgi:hypothetical protein
MLRNLTANAIAPFLAITGIRFDKSWRNAETGFKAWFYANCSTVWANFAADRLASARLIDAAFYASVALLVLGMATVSYAILTNAPAVLWLAGTVWEWCGLLFAAIAYVSAGE